MEQQYDRTLEDTGNCVAFEHVNTAIGADQRLATLFYITGLGLTRDPYLLTGVENMCVNVGRSQFHLPSRPPQTVRGHIGLVLPDRAALLKRLAAVSRQLAETPFEFTEHEDYVEAVSPWNNRFRCHAPDVERFGPVLLGLPYVEFKVPEGTAGRIAAFYREVLGTGAALEKTASGCVARATVGQKQYLCFRETGGPLPEWDGHHVQLYVANFSGPYQWLKSRGLISREADHYQYNFLDIADPETGKPVYRLEHELRPLTHPLFGRALANRNPDQVNATYVPGRDAAYWVTR